MISLRINFNFFQRYTIWHLEMRSYTMCVLLQVYTSYTLLADNPSVFNFRSHPRLCVSTVSTDLKLLQQLHRRRGQHHHFLLRDRFVFNEVQQAGSTTHGDTCRSFLPVLPVENNAIYAQPVFCVGWDYCVQRMLHLVYGSNSPLIFASLIRYSLFHFHPLSCVVVYHLHYHHFHLLLLVQCFILNSKLCCLAIHRRPFPLLYRADVMDSRIILTFTAGFDFMVWTRLKSLHFYSFIHSLVYLFIHLFIYSVSRKQPIKNNDMWTL